MKYEIRMLLRKVFMMAFLGDCDKCQYYDGVFGSDCCFQCEHSITAICFRRKIQCMKK